MSKRAKDSHVVYTPAVLSDNSKNLKKGKYNIKAVIFDLGGVVIEWSGDIAYRYFSKRFGFEFEEMRKRLRKLIPLLQRGDIDEKEYWKRFFESYDKPLSEDWKGLWQKILREVAKLDEGVIDIINSLKRNGYRVAALTNTEPSHYEWIERMGWYNYFEVVVASHIVRMIKPERRIYELILEKLGLEGKECIFIDNKEENVQGSKVAGIPAILFQNAERLREELRKYGVRC